VKLPLQITFQNMASSDVLEADIREHADKLDVFYEKIMSCRIVVEETKKHKHQGHLYQVRIDLKVPGHELVSSRSSDLHHAHEDVYVAVRDSFDEIRRQLEDFVRISRGRVKTHETPPHGKILKLEPLLDYGLIETPDHRDIYFHRNSLIDIDYDALEIGSEVRFTEEAGDLGAQASSVHVVGKHHIV